MTRTSAKTHGDEQFVCVCVCLCCCCEFWVSTRHNWCDWFIMKWWIMPLTLSQFSKFMHQFQIYPAKRRRKKMRVLVVTHQKANESERKWSLWIQYTLHSSHTQTSADMKTCETMFARNNRIINSFFIRFQNKQTRKIAPKITNAEYKCWSIAMSAAPRTIANLRTWNKLENNNSACSSTQHTHVVSSTISCIIFCEKSNYLPFHATPFMRIGIHFVKCCAHSLISIHFFPFSLSIPLFCLSKILKNKIGLMCIIATTLLLFSA